MGTTQNMGDLISMCLLALGLIVMIIALLFIAAFSVDSLTLQKTGIIEVDCYDRQYNVIKGVICEEDDYCTRWGIMNGKKCGDVS